jgi:hypothetical protein
MDFSKLTSKAKKMNINQLIFARQDCLEAMEALNGFPCGLGAKDSNYYKDEAGVYFNELKRRGKL